MISLKEYMIQNHYDAHIHLFNYNSTIMDLCSLPKKYDKFIGFMDFEFEFLDKYKNGNIKKYYDNFIQNHYDPNKMILLATGIDADEIINIYKEYPYIIQGFGELKIYKKYQDFEIPNKSIWDFKKLYDFNKSLKLPIYIHYYMLTDDDMKEFQKLLSMYPEIPFILCHSGISKNSSDEERYEQYFRMKQLLNMNKNLFIDVSYGATLFFNKHPEKLISLPASKILIGSDINPNIKNYYKDEAGIKNRIYKEYNNIKLLDKYINCDETVKKIFNIND